MIQYDQLSFFFLFLLNFVSYFIPFFSYPNFYTGSLFRMMFHAFVSRADLIAHDLFFTCVHQSTCTGYVYNMLKLLNSDIVYSFFTVSYGLYAHMPRARMFIDSCFVRLMSIHGLPTYTGTLLKITFHLTLSMVNFAFYNVFSSVLHFVSYIVFLTMLKAVLDFFFT